jgi:signal transduction histidine kinase
MFNQMRTRTEHFRSLLTTEIPPTSAKRFREHCQSVNYSRARLFAGLIPLFILFLIYPTELYLLVIRQSATHIGRSLMFILTSATLILFAILWLTMSRHERIGRMPNALAGQFLTGAVIAVVLLLSVAATVVDQYLTGTIIAYMIGIFGVAVTISFTFRQSLLAFFGPLFLLLVLLPVSRPTLAAYFTSAGGAFEASVVAWIVSRLLYTQKIQEFNDRRTIERQAVEIQQTNEELAVANASLQQVNDTKTELVNAATRDIKSPLLTIRGYAEVLKGEAASDSPTARSAAHIHALATHVLTTITEILEGAVSSASTLERPLIPVDISELVASVMFVHSGRAEEKAQTLKAEFEDHAVAMADPGWMREVVDHLLTNAIKYSPREKRIAVTVKYSRGAGTIIVVVRDEGPGIPPDELVHIFDRAAQISTRPTGGERSMRVGLWLVRQYVQAMKGGIRCESRVGEGTSFIVELHASDGE